MTYTIENLIATLENLLKPPDETEIFELKEANKSFSFAKIGKYFSALSNEANLHERKCGWLIFGVADNRKIIDTKYRENLKDLHSLKKEIGDKTNNRITFQEIYDFVYKDKRVIMFQIPPASRGVPTSYDEFCYGRDGESLVALSSEKRERIEIQCKQTDWSGKIVPEADFEDLDPEALLVAKANYLKKHPDKVEEAKEWSDRDFLNKAKLTVKGRITNTTLLLLGKPESKYLLSQADATIRWILKDKDGTEIDYYLASCPFLLAVDQIYGKIRNLKYRYMQKGTLFPDEVDKYDPFTIREALNNAIAHQNYTLNGRINVVEMPDSLIFSNMGSFLPGSVEEVIKTNAPEERYRNQFLVTAMQNINMVDTIGSGIRKMFVNQRKKYFPLPDYDLSPTRVIVTIIGKVLDQDYARILSENTSLSIVEVMLLDRIQKKREITKDEATLLRKKNLIEGRRPNYFISREIARKTGKKADYTKNKGLNKGYYLELIIQGIKDNKTLSRKDVETLLLEKLPDCYTDVQKMKKVENLLAELRRGGKIACEGRGRYSYWYLCDESASGI